MSYTQYSLATLTDHIARENSGLTAHEATERAQAIRRELQRLWKCWQRSQMRYRKHNVSVGLRVRERPRKDGKSEPPENEASEELEDEALKKIFKNILKTGAQAAHKVSLSK